MDLNEKFGFDQGLADDGVWLSLDGNGTKIKVAALSNTKSERYLEPIYRRFRSLGEEVPEAIQEEVMARFVLLSWEGIDDAGEALEPTESNRLAMLRKYPRFKAMVIREAQSQQNFRARQEADEIKNS